MAHVDGLVKSLKKQQDMRRGNSKLRRSCSLFRK
jgi:hypothetical protein